MKYLCMILLVLLCNVVYADPPNLFPEPVPVVAPEAQETTVLILFTADWCQPCKELKEYLHTQEALVLLKNIDKFWITDIDKFPLSKEQYNVSVVPCLLYGHLDKNNNVIEKKRVTGFSKTEDSRKKIRDFINVRRK